MEAGGRTSRTNVPDATDRSGGEGFPPNSSSIMNGSGRSGPPSSRSTVCWELRAAFRDAADSAAWENMADTHNEEWARSQGNDHRASHLRVRERTGARELLRPRRLSSGFGGGADLTWVSQTVRRVRLPPGARATLHYRYWKLTSDGSGSLNCTGQRLERSVSYKLSPNFCECLTDVRHAMTLYDVTRCRCLNRKVFHYKSLVARAWAGRLAENHR